MANSLMGLTGLTGLTGSKPLRASAKSTRPQQPGRTSWSRQGEVRTKKELKTMFFLTHGCHAARDAPKKAPPEHS